MFSPPFTPQKVILMAVMAIGVWAYLIWQVRGRWIRYRRKREVIAEGGLRSSGRRRNRRTIFTLILIGAIVFVAGFSVYVDQYGSPLARARLHEVQSRVDGFMRYVLGVAIALL